MQKLLILILGTLAACLAVVAIMEARTVDAGPGAIPIAGKCYKARHAKRTPRFQSERVFLSDQFRHNVEVQVLKLNTACSLAFQEVIYDGSPAGITALGMNCYGIRDVPRQPRFVPQDIEVRDKLSPAGQVLTLRGPQSLCSVAFKLGHEGGSAGIEELEEFSGVCYQAKTAKGQPRFQTRDMAILDNYGVKEARIIRPVAYCSAAEKKTSARNDDFDNEDEMSELPGSEGCESVGPLVCQLHTSTVHATLEDNDPIVSCKMDYTHSVWYRWQATGNASLIIDTQGSSYDTVVAVFTGDKGDLDELACNDDVDVCQIIVGSAGCGPCETGVDVAGCCSGDAAGCCAIVVGNSAGEQCEHPTWSKVQVDAWGGGIEYHILVASSEGRGGKLKFNLQQKADAGTADNCSTPVVLSPLHGVGAYVNVHISTMNAHLAVSGLGVAGSSCNATQDPNPSCAGTFGASVWFTYTPPAHQVVNFDAFDSSYPTVITAYASSSPAEVMCGQGFATAQLNQGQKYLIMVGSTDGDNNYRGGKLKLRMEVKDQLGSTLDGTAAGFDFDSFVCYQVRQPRHNNQFAAIVDQFSIRQIDEPWILIIGAVDSICVPSDKLTCTNIRQVGVGEAAELCY